MITSRAWLISFFLLCAGFSSSVFASGTILQNIVKDTSYYLCQPPNNTFALCTSTYASQLNKLQNATDCYIYSGAWPADFPAGTPVYTTASTGPYWYCPAGGANGTVLLQLISSSTVSCVDPQVPNAAGDACITPPATCGFPSGTVLYSGSYYTPGTSAPTTSCTSNCVMNLSASVGTRDPSGTGWNWTSTMNSTGVACQLNNPSISADYTAYPAASAVSAVPAPAPPVVASAVVPTAPAIAPSDTVDGAAASAVTNANNNTNAANTQKNINDNSTNIQNTINNSSSSIQNNQNSNTTNTINSINSGTAANINGLNNLDHDANIGFGRIHSDLTSSSGVMSSSAISGVVGNQSAAISGLVLDAQNAVVSDETAAGVSSMGWLFNPPINSVCAPFAGVVGGFNVSFDLCPTIANIKLVLSWLFALFGAYRIYMILFS
jgi:phage shock protein PspC (stress-responsive transcriptional regulator)